MKKLFVMFLAVIVVFANMPAVFAKDLLLSYDGSVHKYTGKICSLKVNNELVESDIPPIILNDRSLVPVRAIFEKLGAKVLWDGTNQKVTVSYKDKNVELVINDSNAVINGSKFKMDVPAKIINDRTMVPLRFVGEQLNMKVGWYPEKDEITIDSNVITNFGNLNEIGYIKTENEHQVTISLDKYSDYKIMRLYNQDKIVVDFPNTKVQSDRKQIDVNSDLIKAVRCGQFEEETARVVLDVKGQPQYRLTEENSKLILNLKKAEPAGEVSSDEEVTVPVDSVIDSSEGTGSRELNVKYTAKSDHEEVLIKASSINNYTEFFLNDPNYPKRIVIDIPGATASGKQQIINANGKYVNSVRYAQNEENIARVVIEVEQEPYYKVFKQNGQLLVYISRSAESAEQEPRADTPIADRGEEERGSRLSVKHTDGVKNEQIEMILKDYENYHITKMLDYNRIIVDLPKAVASPDEQKIDVNSDLVKFISYAGVDRSSARVIIELNGKSGYEVLERAGKLVVSLIKSSNDEQPDIGEEPSGEDMSEDAEQTEKTEKDEYEDGTSKDTQEQESEDTVSEDTLENEEPEDVLTEDGADVEIPEDEDKDEVTGDEDSEDDVESDEPQDEENGVLNALKVDYEATGSYDKVVLNVGESKYNVWRLSDPNRIVVDISNMSVKDKENKIDVNGSFIDAIRYSRYGENSARVVIDVTSEPNYQVSKTGDKLTIYIKTPFFKNIAYHNNGDRIHFILDDVLLTEGGEYIKKFFDGKYDMDGKRYTLTFSNDFGNLGSGVMEINDNVLDDVKIIRNEKENKTSMVFTAKDTFSYEVITRGSVNNTAITLLKKASKADKLVVIDAGHGGQEPGTVYGGVQEKNLNLDIAVRLNELLKKHNVKTFMTREDDTYVGLYERAYIANTLNATLFLSIHNNGYLSSHKGTETLYYPQKSNGEGFNGKRFAQIVQDSLVGKLNTKYRKIIERPNLVVLKATKMDAVLAEVAFLTNKEDLARLKTEEFRQQAAEALCEAILQALNEVD